jgi:hypothetical protein
MLIGDLILCPACLYGRWSNLACSFHHVDSFRLPALQVSFTEKCTLTPNLTQKGILLTAECKECLAMCVWICTPWIGKVHADSKFNSRGYTPNRGVQGMPCHVWLDLHTTIWTPMLVHKPPCNKRLVIYLSPSDSIKGLVDVSSPQRVSHKMIFPSAIALDYPVECHIISQPFKGMGFFNAFCHANWRFQRRWKIPCL